MFLKHILYALYMLYYQIVYSFKLNEVVWNLEWLKGCWEAIKRKLYNWYYLIFSIFCFTIKFVLSGYLFIFYLSTIVFMNKISTWFLAVVFLIPRKRSKQEIFGIFWYKKIDILISEIWILYIRKSRVFSGIKKWNF